MKTMMKNIDWQNNVVEFTVSSRENIYDPWQLEIDWDIIFFKLCAVFHLAQPFVSGQKKETIILF